MKQYLMAVQLVEGSEMDGGPDESDDVEALNREMVAQGVWVFGGGLGPRSTASVVRADGGEVLITDGPFAESKEYMAGFWVIKAPDLDAALAWATKASKACRQPVELTPFDDEVD